MEINTEIYGKTILFHTTANKCQTSLRVPDDNRDLNSKLVVDSMNNDPPCRA